MGTAKTEKELREETRARRAKHDLKNTPLPFKRRGSPTKKLFDKKIGTSNNLTINRLRNTRVATGLVHSKSMSDLRDVGVDVETSLTRSKSFSNLSSTASSKVSCGDLLKYIGGGGRYRVSCQNLIDKYTTRSLSSSSLGPSSSSRLGRYTSKSCSNLTSLTDHEPLDSTLARSKSYSRLTEEKSSYELKQASYRSTIRNIYTNLKDFSARTVSALSSNRNNSNNIKVGPRITSASQLPDPLHYDSHRSSLNRSLSKLPEDLTSDHSMKSFRQAKLANSFLNGGSSISSYIGNTYRQYSSNFSSTSTGSKTRFSNMKSVFAV